ncbi:hypothetical protein ACROYT_G025199 [Oculina patagonica]
MAYSALRSIRRIRFPRRGSCNNNEELNVPVIYLGSVQILCPIGEGICGSVEEIFENCQIKLKHNLLPKQSLQVKDDSFELSKGDEEDRGAKTVYKFNRIVYCGVDGKRRKILVFNYHHGEGEERDIYLTQAFMCENKSAAKKLAMTVSEYFQRVKFIGSQEVVENFDENPQLEIKIGTSMIEKDSKNNMGTFISESEIELGSIMS